VNFQIFILSSLVFRPNSHKFLTLLKFLFCKKKNIKFNCCNVLWIIKEKRKYIKHRLSVTFLKSVSISWVSCHIIRFYFIWNIIEKHMRKIYAIRGLAAVMMIWMLTIGRGVWWPPKAPSGSRALEEVSGGRTSREFVHHYKLEACEFSDFHPFFISFSADFISYETLLRNILYTKSNCLDMEINTNLKYMCIGSIILLKSRARQNGDWCDKCITICP
jgi:hypothetical protein